MAGIALLVIGLVVFAKSVDRFLDRFNLRLLQSVGLASRDREADD